ncbi:hypothetical protein KIH87_18595 [Paraneptunicella aestuarii]|uniref:hypothetical protein n=1 Tax=Paraneptunicella aestuarii TaxID=2831148 RepID=UPI001E372451|nr:hypothetical protein [Paraneptunicella aestuarii]UAA38643.1 hypothetical protein KIH87_18595 [Paraneptunicella aestuarii]
MGNSAYANESIAIKDLGSLELEFTQVKTADVYNGQPLSAEVTFSMSQQFLITAPFQPQRVDMLFPHGTPVKQGQIIATLSGSEVHHFQEQLASQEFVYGVSLKRYNEGKNLFEKGAISIHVWSEIAEQYHAIRIELGHLQHFSELLNIDSAHMDTAKLMAPADGILFYPEMLNLDTMDPVLGAIIPADKIRLAVAAPVQLAGQIESVSTRLCANMPIKIENMEGTAENFHVSLWSEPLPESCSLKLGQTLRVVPQLEQASMLVPQSSVFNWQNSSHVLVKQGNQVQAVPVNVLASNRTVNQVAQYYLELNSALTNNEVLSRSVSAVQGMMAGMGGE